MPRLITRTEKRVARHRRIRKKVHGTTTRPRLSVFRSLRHIYVQVIDDETGHTLTAASSKEPVAATEAKGPSKQQVAHVVGTIIAQRALKLGVSQGVLDSGGYKYHGRVKALAEGAREGGLDF